jgi:hypothetical protein
MKSFRNLSGFLQGKPGSNVSSRIPLGLLHRFAVPLILFVVTALAYGWQLGRLGFYWDDWVFVSRFQSMGVFNTIFYGGTRQLGVFALMPGFLFAGDSPLLWHIYSLLLRWVVALLFWWVLNKFWPERRTSVTLMAALFAVHPAFSQQSIAVVYSLQFVNYAIFLASLGFMLNAERMFSQAPEPGFRAWSRWLWLGLALLTQALHLFIVEYFVGLELIRPLVLFLFQSESNRSGKLLRFKKAFQHWLPYLLILSIYAVWRSGVLGGGFDTYEYKTITSLLRTNPQGAFTETLEYGLKDILVLLVNTWHGTLAPTIIDLSQPYNFFSLGVAALSALGLYFVISRPAFDPAAGEGAKSGQFLRQAVVLSLFAVLVSFIPSWFVRRHIVEPGNFGDRFALAGLFGASILLVACAQFFGGQRGRGTLLAALFIGLAIGAQIRFANDYRWDWERQLRTYWQVSWRAPALQPGTVLVGYDAISTTTVNYVGGFAFNDLYQPAHPSALTGTLPAWYVNYPKTPISANLDKFLAGDWIYVDEFDNISVAVRRDNSLAVDYTDGRCVQILTSDDRVNYNLPDDFRPVAGFSNQALVLSQGGVTPSQRIFGQAPRPTWCYYFQKAELARQFGDWERVTVLKKEADQAGFEPFNAYELFPFIEAYAMRAEWGPAQKLTSQAYKALPKSSDGLCLIWKRVGNSPSKLAGYGAVFPQVSTQLGCR